MGAEVRSAGRNRRWLLAWGGVGFACALIASAIALVRVEPKARLRLTGVDRAAILVDRPGGRPGSSVVTVGVPLPRNLGVTKLGQLGVWTDPEVDEGTPLRAQWRVLSRWDGTPEDDSRPIRWALCHFEAPEGTRFRLRTGPGADAQEWDTPLALEAADGGYVVDTGRLRFTVPVDRFAPLADLIVRTVAKDGTTYARSITGTEGLEGVLVLADETGSGPDREHRLSVAPPERVVLEENGPLRCVLRIDGTWGDTRGHRALDGWAGYTLRVTADAGSDTLGLAFTLRNDGRYGYPAELTGTGTGTGARWMFVRSLTLRMPTGLRSPLSATVEGGSWPLADAAVAPFRLVQTHERRSANDESHNLRFEVTGCTVGREDEGVRPLWRGRRSGGSLLVDDGRGGVLATVRHFWEQYPGALSFADGVLRYELLPRQRGQRWPADLPEALGDAYQFEGGRHKTYELSLGFPRVPGEAHGLAAMRRSLVQGSALSVAAPPVGRVESDWLISSGAAGPLGPVAAGSADGDLGFASAHLERLQRALVDVAHGERQLAGGRLGPVSLSTQRERRGGAVPGHELDLDHYGFMTFGDIAHEGGFASGHHDWVRGLFLAWARLGDRAFLDRGTEMLGHRVDVDQYHVREPSPDAWRSAQGLQRFPAGYHGSRSDLAPAGEVAPTAARTWLEGLLLAYALRGDARALETARSNARALQAVCSERAGLFDGLDRPGAIWDRLETLGNAVTQLLAYAEFTGDARALDAARVAARRGLLRLEDLAAQDGSFEPGRGRKELAPLLTALPALARLHRMLSDAEDPADRALADRSMAMLVRVLAWFEQEAYAGSGAVKGGLYLPLQLPLAHEPDRAPRETADGYIPFDFVTADAFAYAARVTGVRRFRTFAARLFRDSVLFYQAPSFRALAPGYYARASYSPVRYAGSETRSGALLLGAHQEVLRSIVGAEDAPRLPLQGLVGVYGPDRPGFSRSLRVIPNVPRDRGAQDATRAGGGERGPGRGGGDETSRLPPLEPVVLDDADCVVEGAWAEMREQRAHAGGQRVAVSPDGDSTATFTTRVERSGRYLVSLWWGRCAGAADNARVEVRHAGGVDAKRVNQSVNAGEWRLVGEYVLSATRPVVVRLSNQAARGVVVADAVRIEEAP